MLKRIRAAMGQRDETHQLSGIIEFNDSYFGGPTAGQKRGRGTEKAKVFVALSLNSSGSPLYLKMKVTNNIKQASVKKFAQSAFAASCTIRSDGFRSYIPALEEYTHEHKPYDPNSGLLHWLHIVISNAKAFILGIYHGLPKDNLQSYLDEYCFRFSRRNFGNALLECLTLAVGTSVRLSYRDNHKSFLCSSGKILLCFQSSSTVAVFSVCKNYYTHTNQCNPEYHFL